MELVKLIHVSCAALSITGFIARGILMMRDSPRMKVRWVKTVPHIVDTILLTTAIVLAVQLDVSPVNSPWVFAKIIALVIYIGLGVVAFRFGSTKQIRIIAWLCALSVFAYIVLVAITKSPIIISR